MAFPLKGLTEQARGPWLPAATIAGLEARVSATLGLDLASPDLGGISGTLVRGKVDSYMGAAAYRMDAKTVEPYVERPRGPHAAATT